MTSGHGNRPAGPARASRLRAQDGFTLIEVIVAAVVLAVGLLGLFGLLDTAVKATDTTRAREGATNLARQLLEDARTIAYSQLSPGAVTEELQAMPGASDASAEAGWQISRRGVTYTVTAVECAVDDPKDGYGKHVNQFGENQFCSESSTEGTTDTQPEDFKRVTVTVKWKARGRSYNVQRIELLTAAGEAPGLTPSNLHLEEPAIEPSTAPVVTVEPAGETLKFAVSSPTGTAAMRWSLDGSTQPTSPTLKSGTTWTFSWAIPYPSISDGTYQVSVQAVDSTGVTGPPLTIPVTLLRGTPKEVAGIKGGFNSVNFGKGYEQVVELEWKANTERNVIGYRVFDPSGTRVCPASAETLSTALSCVDKEPPSPSASNLTFKVAALYRNAAGAIAQAPSGSFAVEKGPPAAPNPPTGLELNGNPDGSVTLRWKAPASGPAVSFYRVYRDSSQYSGRYGATSGSATEFSDGDHEFSHTYWVTSVNSNLRESSTVTVTG